MRRIQYRIQISIKGEDIQFSAGISVLNVWLAIENKLSALCSCLIGTRAPNTHCQPRARPAVSCLNCARAGVDHCTILPDSAGGQLFELRSTERLLTCHSLACETLGCARPWSVECAADAGTCLYVLILVGRPVIFTPGFTPPPFSLSGTRQTTAVY